MAWDASKIAFCFFFVLVQANCQVRLAEEVNSKEEYPYHAHIETAYRDADRNVDWKGGGCGGVIVSGHYVLTAAHCVTRTNEMQGKVIPRLHAVLSFGMLNRDIANGFKQRMIVNRDEDFMLHDQAQTHFNSDIALIHTQDKINIDNVEIARAVLGNPLSMSQEGWECDVSGWGRSTLGEIRVGKNSRVLKSARNTIRGVQLINNEIHVTGEFSMQWTWPLLYDIATEIYSYVLGRPVQMMIAPSPMSGDSGGPLSCYPRSRLFNYGQHKSVYGVLKGGPAGVGGGHGEPAKYTRIAFHHEWIAQRVTGHDGERALLDGRDAVMGQFPYQAAIFDKDYTVFKCSGAVVSKFWVLSGASCFEKHGVVLAGEVDHATLRNPKRQMLTCLEPSHARNGLQLCRVGAGFNFNRFVKQIDLAPERFVPVECQFASWDLNAAENKHYKYLTWKKANFKGADQNGGPLDVEEVNLFRVEPEDVTSAGAALVCSGAGGGRFLVGMSGETRVDARFVDIRDYVEWINLTAELE